MVDTLERIAPRGYQFDPQTVLYLPLYKMEFVRSANLLTNPSFETGDPPTGWGEGGATWSRSTDQVYAGTYSGKLVRVTTDAFAYQIYGGFAKYKGLVAQLDSMAYATVATRAQPQLYDGITGTFGAAHSGVTGWEAISVTKTLAITATQLRAAFWCRTGDTSAYFDQADMYIPNLAMSKDHYGHLVQNAGAVWTFPYGYLFDKIDDVITIPDHTALQNIFDSPGGTIIAWINPTSDGEGDNGRIIQKSDATKGWILQVSSEAGGYVKITFTQYFSTTAGIWTTTSAKVPISWASLITVAYDNSSVGNDPIISIDGNPIPITEVQTPVGTRVTDAAYPLTVGNNVATTATFDGYIPEVMANKGKMVQPPELQGIFQSTKGRYGR